MKQVNEDLMLPPLGNLTMSNVQEEEKPETPTVSIDLDRIAQIESSGNPNAVGDQGASIGLYQIGAALPDWNKFGPGPKYVKSQLKDPIVNKSIADWYMNKRIPLMLVSKGVPITERNVLAAYNWGAKNVQKWHKSGGKDDLLPSVTAKYIKKYFNLAKKKMKEGV